MCFIFILNFILFKYIEEIIIRINICNDIYKILRIIYISNKSNYYKSNKHNNEYVETLS